MTTQAELQRLLKGEDPTANGLVKHLLSKGWFADRIIKNIATKEYSPHRALIRVTLDSENDQYWVNGEYTSKGENVLSGCFACIKTGSSLEDSNAAMDDFLEEVEDRIGQSFAVRFLAKKKIPVTMGTSWSW
jgi:hypothetical protein